MQSRAWRRDNVRATRAYNFATELSDALYELKLTHKDVARELGITRYAVDSWTRAADPAMPSAENLNRLCALLEARKTGMGVQIARAAGASQDAGSSSPLVPI